MRLPLGYNRNAVGSLLWQLTDIIFCYYVKTCEYDAILKPRLIDEGSCLMYHDSVNLAARDAKTFKLKESQMWQEAKSMGGWKIWGMRSFLTKVLSNLSARLMQWCYFVKAHPMAFPHRLDNSTREYPFILVQVNNFWFVINCRDIQNDLGLLRQITSISVCSLLYLLRKRSQYKEWRIVIVTTFAQTNTAQWFNRLYAIVQSS